MKMCACMMYAGLTNTSCVLEAKCVTGPNACLVRGPGTQTSMRPCFWVSSSLCLTTRSFSTISLPHTLSAQLPWSLTHSLCLTYLTLRRILQPCARIRAADPFDDPSVRVRHDSRASIYLVLCKAERCEHYDDIYGDWHTAERHVRSDFLTLKIDSNAAIPIHFAALCRKSLIPHTFNHSFHSLYTPSYRWNITKIIECAQLRRDVKVDVGDAVVLPLFLIFYIAAIVNFPLMWLQIVYKSKKLQHGVRPTRIRI